MKASSRSMPKFGRRSDISEWWDPEVAKEEAEKLRREFDETMAKCMADPEYFDKLAKQGAAADEIPPELASQRAARTAATHVDVLGDGRLRKKSVRAVARGPGGRRKPRYGDEVSCVASLATGGVEVAAGPVRFVVGALAVPQVLSAAAASLGEGETAEFEAAASLAFGDDRFDADRRRAMMMGRAFPGVAVEDGVQVRLELKAVRAVEGGAQDISGGLGPGHVLRRVTREGFGFPATPRCDVVYRRTVYAPQPPEWVWPREEDLGEGESPFANDDLDRRLRDDGPSAETSVSALGLDLEALASARVVAPEERRKSVCETAPSKRRDDDYVERLLVEASKLGEESIAYLSPRAAQAYLGLDRAVLVTLRTEEWTETEDCVPDRFGAVTKKVVRRGEGIRPRDCDVVVVRGVVKADDGAVACAYGGAAAEVSSSSSSSSSSMSASWTLDDDPDAAIAGGVLRVPLCAGIEYAVKTMARGEIADVAISSDLAFVRTPPSADPPAHARPRDILAFHYATAAYSSLPASVFSKPLVARLELVDFEPLFASTTRRALLGSRREDATTTFADDAQGPLDDALRLKALGNSHFKVKAFSRAARRYSDALAAVAAGADVARTLALVSRQPPRRTSATDFIDPETLPPQFREPKETDDDRRKKKIRRDEARLADLKLALFLNRAACDLKRCDFQRCLDDCASVLQARPDDIKALYRSGLAHVSLEDLANARACFDRCLAVDKNCVEARRALANIDKLEREPSKHPRNGTTAFGVSGGGFGSGASGSAVVRRRPRDRSGGPDEPAPKPLTEQEKLDQEWLADLEFSKPPDLRAPVPPKPVAPDHSDRPTKR